MAEPNIASSDMDRDKVREGPVSDASSSKGNKKREPIPLTPKIQLLLDRLEPVKGRQAKFRTEHLTG